MSIYENFERSRLESIYNTIEPYSMMRENERYFLNGMIRYFKPRKILEVGISSGGGSAIILNAISDIDDAKLYSVDILNRSFLYPDKPTGFFVDEKFPQLKSKWHVFRGGDVSRFIEDIGGDIDMLVLDTAHVHPWETVNFMCVLPFMNKNFSWTILHDITFHVNNGARDLLACRYLFGHVVAEEKITPEPEDSAKVFSNIGAFRVSYDTMKYSQNLFESLVIPWHAKISSDDILSIRQIIEKYYSPEQLEFFDKAVNFQAYIMEHPATFKSSLRIMLKQSFPRLFYTMRKLKYRVK